MREGNAEDTDQIFWPEHEIDLTALRRAYNKDDDPEHGAEAIALLLVCERTDYTAIQRSVTSTGIDYWLGYKSDMNDDELFNHRSACLKVSAILRQTKTNRVSSRIGQKTKQSKSSDYTSFPVYIVIVEFSQPLAEVKVRS